MSFVFSILSIKSVYGLHEKRTFLISDHDDEDDRASEPPNYAILDTEPTVAISRVFARG